ncbi:MAG: tetratricopeptide repeat protein [Cytophagaceae bacterium]
MKRFFLVLLLPFLCLNLSAQNKEEAEKIVEEGVALHDQGQFEAAIAKYDKALELDKDNLTALAEKALTLVSLKKYDESITYCEKAIAKYPGEKQLKSVYVTYGNSLDALKQPDKALKIYDEGIKLYPDFYQLPFNKGITLTGQDKYEEALPCFQKAMMLNPKHASSHNAVGVLMKLKNKRIPSLLANCRFLVLEPEGNRAKNNLQNLRLVMKGNAEQTGKNSITININPDMLGDTLPNGKPAENSFKTTDMILMMSSALDYDKKNKKKTEVEQFIRKFDIVCSSMKETQLDSYGFFWDYYAPYFIEMKEKNFIETFAYIAFASSDDPAVTKWLKAHKTEIGNFYEWSKSFEWKKN